MLKFIDQPIGRAQQPGIVAAPADQLHAERHAALPGQYGNDNAGSPVSVHNVQNIGLPVASPFGATPVAAGVMMAS